ncbi:MULTISPECIES: glycosyltransferase family 2 protein [Cryobacterium]|nr:MULTISPECIES: glycosyltransferase family 2 protein [Cryobacterium]
MRSNRMAVAAKSQSTTAHVAVVTVSYGSGRVLGDFLGSLGSALTGPLHIVVADNKVLEGDTTVSGLAHAAHAEYLPLADNLGYGHAINQALKTLPAEIDWVVVSNPDIVARAGAIDTLLKSVGDDAKIAAIGPGILTSAGEVYPSARVIPSLRTGIGHGLFALVWPNNPWSRSYRQQGAASVSRRDAGWLSGAFLMVRRSVLDELGGFDEGYFMYFEDVDLGFRIGKLGLRNVYEPLATVVHSGAHSTQDDNARMIRAHHASAERFLSKKYSGPLLLPVRLLLAAGLRLRAAVSERRHPTS